MEENADINRTFGFEFIYQTYSYFKYNGFAMSLSHLKACLESGLKLQEIKKIIPCKSVESDGKIPQKVFAFCNNVVFKVWSEVRNRVGKDNRIEGGDIIENLGDDKYLITLASQFDNFHLSSNDTLNRADPTDYGYIPSSPYTESVVVNDEGPRNALLAFMIKSYVAYDDFIYNLRSE